MEGRNEERRREELEARRQALEEIRRQVALLPATPRVVGVARIVPQVPEPEMREDPAIEAVGMRVAITSGPRAVSRRTSPPRTWGTTCAPWPPTAPSAT
ncbi:MAG: hypothetical protein N0A03_08290 [Anaerolineae bacterium]|nr:hypothetical protein [Anaerolineae bacterium]